MKRQWICLFIISFLQCCLIASGTAPLKANDIKEPIIVDSLLAVDQLSGSIYYQENFITVDSNWQEGNTYIGDYYDWAWMVHFASIGYLSFEIPTIPDGYELQSATLWLYFQSWSSNSGGGYPIFNLGSNTVYPDCILEHIDYGNAFNSNDVIPNTIYGTYTLFSQSTYIPPCWISFDVNDCLLSDISVNRPLSQFRIFLQGFSDWDNWDDFVVYASYSNLQLLHSPKIKYILFDNSNNNDPNNPTPKIKLSCYPNPFNPETTISYDLIKYDKVKLEIFNIKGQLIKTLVNETKDAGSFSVKWDGKNDKMQKVALGVYFYKLTTSEKTLTKKMLLLK